MGEEQKTAYRNLQVWQKSMSLASEIIKITVDLNTDRKHFRLIEQLESAAASIPLNIAEGKGRESKKEFMHFLYIARGSMYETLTLLELFLRQGWIYQDTFSKLEYDSIEIIRMLKGLINAVAQN